MIHIGGAFGVIRKLELSPAEDMPIGSRISCLREIIKEAERVERKLILQVGADFAKHLSASGIEPTGEPIGERLKKLGVAR